jgi:hypothetical protein
VRSQIATTAPRYRQPMTRSPGEYDSAGSSPTSTPKRHAGACWPRCGHSIRCETCSDLETARAAIRKMSGPSGTNLPITRLFRHLWGEPAVWRLPGDALDPGWMKWLCRTFKLRVDAGWSMFTRNPDLEWSRPDGSCCVFTRWMASVSAGLARCGAKWRDYLSFGGPTSSIVSRQQIRRPSSVVMPSHEEV